VEARLPRPLPALRRGKAVPRVSEGRQQLLGLRARLHAAPRRRLAGLSRDRHRRPYGGADRTLDRNGLFAAGVAAACDLSAVHADRLARIAAARERRRRWPAMGAEDARL